MTDVFISYSRRDSAVAARLCDALSRREKSVYIDVGERLLRDSAAHDAGDGADRRARSEVAGIPPSAPWMEEIRSAIAAADTVLVLVSPDSCTSPVCRAELESAAELNKRLIPVRVRDTPAEALPGEIAALNVFDLGPGRDFDADVDQLVTVLDTDIDRLRLHTRLTVRAHEWESDSRDRSRALRGKELSAAERWLAEQSARTPAPTVTQAAYITASRAAATRRHRTLIATAAVLAAAMAALTSVAGIEWRSSVAHRQAAITQRNIADRQHAMALSRQLASASDSVDPANHVIARRLAVAAWHAYPTEEAGSALAARLAEQQQNGLLPVDADDTHSGGDIMGDLAFRPDGQLLATEDFSGDAGSSYSVVRFWSPLTRQSVGPTIRFGSDQGGSDHIMFTPDGKFLATAGSGGMRLWDPVTGRPVTATLYVKAQLGSVFAPRGQLLAAVDSGGGLRVWHLAADHPVGDPRWIRGSISGDGVAFSPDGTLLATNTGGKLQLWNPVTGHQVGTPLRTSLVDDLGVAFSPDGKFLAAAGSSQSVFLWHLVDGHPAGAPLHISGPGGVGEMAFGGGGNLLAVGYSNGTIQLWNPATGHPAGAPFQADDAINMAFSPAGKILATTGRSGMRGDGTVQLWDPATGRPFGGTFQTDAGSHGGVRELAFSPRGGLLAATDNDGTLEQWDMLTGHPSALYQANPRSATIGAAFSLSGQLVASALNAFGGVVFWDPVSGHPAGVELRSGHQEAIQGVAFSPDGKLVATSGVGTMLWNRATGQSAGHFLPSSSQSAVAFSPHGQLLATGGDKGTVQLWNSATERSVRTFQTGGLDTVHEVAFSPDGTLLASADSDGTVRMWNTVTGRPVGLPIPAGDNLGLGVSAVAFTSDGKFLASVSDATGTVRLWDVSLFANPYAALCTDTGPPTRQEWNQYAPGEPPTKACVS